MSAPGVNTGAGMPPEPTEPGMQFHFDRLQQNAIVRLSAFNEHGQLITIQSALVAEQIHALYGALLSAVLQLAPSGAMQ